MRLYALDVFMTSLLVGDHFVAKSEYQDKLAEYSDLCNWFEVLRSSGTLEDYCHKNDTSTSDVDAILTRYNSFPSLVDEHNEIYIKSKMISEKDYLDSVLKDCDPNILLDADQRRVVLTDEDYCLVVAGAGAGKTTTVAAKVKYLVDKQGVDGLNQLNGYGKLSEIKREDVQFLVDWLIGSHFILKTKGKYPVLHPTYNGEHYSEMITRQKLQSLKKILQNME